MPEVQTAYTAPAAGSAPLVVRCTRVTSRMTFVEANATNTGPFGLIYNLLTALPFGKYTVGPTVMIPAQYEPEPTLIAGYPGDHPPNTVPIGNGGSGGQPVAPGGPETLGTPIFQVTSASATPTTVLVTEWY